MTVVVVGNSTTLQKPAYVITLNLLICNVISDDYGDMYSRTRHQRKFLMGYIFYTRERLEPVVKSSVCLSEVLRKLGRKPSLSPTRHRVREYIKTYGIDTSHFTNPTSWAERRRSWLTRSDQLENRKRWMNTAIERNIRFVVEYLKRHPCADCPETNPLVLEFDHVRGKKKYSVSALIGQGKSLTTIKKEIEKCDVRCANCHRIKTAHQLHYKMINYL